MAIALAISTVVLVFATNGYGVDRKTGTIIQNGLIFVGAHPEAANVTINGQDKGTTDGRYVLEEGKYTVKLSRDGYRDWQRDVTLEGGSVERLVYPFLFPQKLASKDVQLTAAPMDLISSSPDRHWILTHQTGNLPAFDVTDATTKDNTATAITVPSAVLPAHEGAYKLEVVEWSTDNRHALLKYSYDKGSDFIIIDRTDPQQSYNVGQLFGKTFTQVALHDKRVDQLYLLDGAGVLYSGDVKAKTTNVIALQVQAYFPYGSNMLLYATTQGAEKDKAIYKLRQDTTDYAMRTVPAGSKFLMNMAEFSGHMYVVLGTSSESKVYIYQDPLSLLRRISEQALPAKALLKIDGGAESVSFSTNARFVALQGGSKFAVYDFENTRQFRYDMQLPTDPGEKSAWMDGHRMSLVSGGKLQVFDFDGTNKQTLVALAPTTSPCFDTGYNAMFTVSPSMAVPERYALLRTELKVTK